MGKYSELLRRATNSIDYWTQVAIRSFVRDLAERMDAQDISNAALAKKIGVSPAYVSKVMRGDANFTLETMTKLAMAVGGKVQTRIVDADTKLMQRDLPASAWEISATSRRRSSRSSTVVVGISTEIIAANDWKFASAPQVMDAVALEEMRAA